MSRPWRIVRIALRLVLVAVVLLLLCYVVIPQFIEAAGALRTIRGLSPWPLLAGLALELASLATLAALTRTALDPRDRPRYGTVLRVDLAGVAVTNAVPGGGAFALAVRYRFLARAGSTPSTIVGGLAVEGIVSNLLLGGVFAVGLLCSLADLPPSPYYLVAGAVMVLIFGTASIALAIAVRRRARVVDAARSAALRLPEAWRARVVAFVDDAVGNVAALAADRRRFAAALFWGAANWLLDAAALWVLLAAFGYRAGAGELLLIYGLTGILSIVPITPGGVGIVEGVMVPLLVASGAPSDAAVLGVVAWRLVQFWMPMPLGGLSALSLLLWPGGRRAVERS